MSEFLQFLIPDRDYGYLFPHSRSVAAFGAVSEYHIIKHRPHLTEGVHFIKSAGNGADHVMRVFYTFSGLLLLSDLVGSAQAVQLKQALLDHAQRQAQAPGALVPSHGGGVRHTQPQVQPTEPYDSTDAQPGQSQQWGQPAIHQPGQLVPNAHGYLPLQQTYGQPQPYGQSDPAHQVAAALAPYVDRSVNQTVLRHLGAAQSQQEQSLQLVEAVTNTMLKAQGQTAEQVSRAYEQAAGNPNHRSASTAPSVLLLESRSRSGWWQANDGWFTLLLGVSLVALVGIGSWLIASVVMNGMRSPNSQPVRLAPAYPSSAMPLN